jgi:hypothetical protein
LDDAAHIPYRIEFYDPSGLVIRVAAVYAVDYADACDQGWDNLPDGADDFQITLPACDTESAS